ncbi:MULTISPECIES: type VI secretion system ATPase TssH [Pseudoalteromonas]|uniref:Type VI secretion system protein VasG n=1 Tax=Pseudoalteromonas aurantia 208 TaxID=1314867 RepID=A0ABR9EF88_9GAMM|nr:MULTISPECIES: type VI secretion system ATPase TssH [Pseudoalteromonas]MBE0369638.1 type VI secretion system protein VasG [Pseudoalteromonas aurantia 208]MBQ4844175.1 type VI secretion system ATPase TssH [Pseudoalteromonas sp. MMG005]
MSQVSISKLISYLDGNLKNALEYAAADAMKSQVGAIEVEHWLMSLLQGRDPKLQQFLESQKVDIAGFLQELEQKINKLEKVHSGQPTISPELIETVKSAWLVASVEFSHNSVAGLHLLLSILQPDPLAFNNKDFKALKNVSLESLKEHIKTLAVTTKGKSAGSAPAAVVTGALDKFTVNLTEAAKNGELDIISGRSEEVRQAIDILCRKRQNNPIFVGEPGVGKTAVVEGLAQKIANNEVPAVLAGVQIHTLDLGLLQAGASVKGEFENRLKDVINEVKTSEVPIVVFIDEAHTLIGAGGAEGQNDAANLLKPALARGEFRTLAATTWEEYKKYFEKDPALTRRFQVVKIDEPNEEDALQMLRGVAESLKSHHNVFITEAALEAAVNLSIRYLPSRKLPDKAISILDTSCARIALTQSAKPAQIESVEQRIRYLENEIVSLNKEDDMLSNQQQAIVEKEHSKIGFEQQLVDLTTQWDKEKVLAKQLAEIQKGEAQGDFAELLAQLKSLQGEDPMIHAIVDEQTIAEVIGAWTGIPVGNLLKDEVAKLLSLEDSLHQRIIGQSHAMNELAKSIRVSRAGLTDKRKPVGVFLMCGPSGVGKSETALTLADQLFGGEQDMTIINMTEFKEAHKVSMLLGSPAGYVGYGKGGVLTEAIRRNPYCVLLLDEMEKAHPSVHDIFYQIFDKGCIQDSEGRNIDFRNTLIIMTSNAADSAIVDYCNDQADRPDMISLVDNVRPALQEFFKPAFLGRCNIIPYYPLNEQELAQITEISLQRVANKLKETYEATLQYDQQFVDYVVTKGNEPTIGGRAIEQIINRHLMPLLAERCIEKISQGEVISTVDICGHADTSGFDLSIS